MFSRKIGLFFNKAVEYCLRDIKRNKLKSGDSNPGSATLRKRSINLIGQFQNLRGSVVLNRANRYLKYQEGRIWKAIDARQYKKALIIMILLLKSSAAYQTLKYTQVDKS